jgi:hypothetical protein
METRSSIYSNAGARIMSSRGGNHNIAMELFRAALECLRANERREPDADNWEESIHGQAESGSNAIFRRAEMHLLHLDDYTTLETDEPSILELGRVPFAQPLQDSTRRHMNVLIAPIQGNGYHPFVYAYPFHLSEHDHMLPQVKSCLIVFNMGLIHQLLNRPSRVVESFYGLALSMISGVPETPDTILVRLALSNNLGVWSFDIGDGELMCTCIESLARLLGSASYQHVEINSMTLIGFQTNIREMLSPADGGSPAA